MNEAEAANTSSAAKTQNMEATASMAWALRKETRLRILWLLSRMGKSTVIELCEALGQKYRTVREHIQTLELLGAVRKFHGTVRGRTVTAYELDPQWLAQAQAAMNLTLEDLLKGPAAAQEPRTEAQQGSGRRNGLWGLLRAAVGVKEGR